MSIFLKFLLFIGDYLGLLKNDGTAQVTKHSKSTPPSNGENSQKRISLDLTQERMFKLERLLRVLVDKIRFPIDAGADEMEEFEEDRHELLTIVRSIARIDGNLVLEAIKSFLTHSLLQISSTHVKEIDETTLARLEACLYLFFALGEFYKVSFS